MKAFCYGVWIQFLMDLRSRSLFITCYLVPLLFFFMMGSVFTSIMPEYQDTLIASMTIMSVSMGSLLGLSSSVVQIYGTTLQKTYMANSLPVYYGLMTLFVSAFFHLMIVSTLILILSPILFHATLPSHIGIYYFHLILFIISSLGIASVLGLFVKTQGLLTMMSQIIYVAIFFRKFRKTFSSNMGLFIVNTITGTIYFDFDHNSCFIDLFSKNALFLFFYKMI